MNRRDCTASYGGHGGRCNWWSLCGGSRPDVDFWVGAVFEVTVAKGKDSPNTGRVTLIAELPVIVVSAPDAQLPMLAPEHGEILYRAVQPALVS